ncbi:hypothetical protein BKI52_11450 [marine bacterium AO1-C]|nr:hypothetical protein BKI52_11450 [marine bacterium AO1-C]
MEDKDKKNEGVENAQELGNEEKVNIFRELIVGPDKREIEGQLQGMKELFATMLVENKKDYDNQVNDMRTLFVNVLEENRRVFQMQLQDLYKNLPSLINSSLREQNDEGFIVLADQQVNQPVQQGTGIDRYSRLDAVKEIIVGGNIRDLQQNLADSHKLLGQNFEEDKKKILEMAQEVSGLVDAMEQRLNAKFKELIDQISKNVTEYSRNYTKRERAADKLRDLAQNM